MTVNKEKLRELFNTYLECCDDNLDSNDRLPGLNVDMNQAKTLLDDVIIFAENM